MMFKKFNKKIINLIYAKYINYNSLKKKIMINLLLEEDMIVLL